MVNSPGVRVVAVGQAGAHVFQTVAARRHCCGIESATVVLHFQRHLAAVQFEAQPDLGGLGVFDDAKIKVKAVEL